MKVIVNNQVFDASDGNKDKIAVFLTDEDKFNIAHMSPKARIYAVYDKDKHNIDDVKDWTKRIRIKAEKE